MPEDKKSLEIRKYINDLKMIKSEVTQILDGGNEKKISRAANHYPARLNHLLTKRNIISASGLFPFIDLAILHTRKQDVELLDLNIKKDDIDQLCDVIRRIERELEEINSISEFPQGNNGV